MTLKNLCDLAAPAACVGVTVNEVNQWITLAVGVLTILWFAVRFYDRFFSKKGKSK